MRSATREVCLWGLDNSKMRRPIRGLVEFQPTLCTKIWEINLAVDSAKIGGGGGQESFRMLGVEGLSPLVRQAENQNRNSVWCAQGSRCDTLRRASRIPKDTFDKFGEPVVSLARCLRSVSADTESAGIRWGRRLPGEIDLSTAKLAECVWREVA